MSPGGHDGDLDGYEGVKEALRDTRMTLAGDRKVAADKRGFAKMKRAG